jgi:DNA polymerase
MSTATDASVVGRWASLRDQASVCRSCGLCETRTNVVFGSGLPTARVVIIGEAPGAREDASGQPFVGPSGSLLVKLLAEETGLTREDVVITNVVKCRPPANRNPTRDEIATCTPWLAQQFAMLQPAVIVPVGNFASRWLLGTKLGITDIRGRTYAGSSAVGVSLTEKTTIVPTFHPSAALQGGGARVIQAMREDLGVVATLLAVDRLALLPVGESC